MASRGAEINPIEVRLFRVFGLWCPSCARSCERSLQRSPGVREARLDFASGQLKLAFDAMQLSLAEIKTLVQRLGFSLIEDGDAEAGSGSQVESMYLRSLALAWFFGMWVTLLQLWTYVQESPLEPWIQLASALLTLPVLSLGAWPFWKASWHGLRSRNLNLDLVVLLANLSLYISSLLALSESRDAVFFDSIVMSISTILTLRWLDYRLRTEGGEARELRAFYSKEVVVRALDEGTVILASSAQIGRGREVLLGPGDELAFDGKLAAGELWIDSSLLSGESQARLYRPGAELLAGMKVASGEGRLAVERVIGERWIDQQLFQEGLNSTARGSQKQRLEQIYRYWLPTLLLAACLGALLVGGAGAERLERFALILLVGCPCLLLMAPTLLRLRLARELKAQGIGLQHPDVLERATHLRTLVFDKTGTLTRPRALRLDYRADTTREPELLLEEARRLLSSIDHPLQALSRGSSLAAGELFVETHPGQGSVLRMRGQEPIYLGRSSFVAQQLAKPLPSDAMTRGLWWGQGTAWKASFLWDEELEAGPASEAMLRQLEAAAYRLVLASGDRAPYEEAAWLRCFQALHFELLPAAKVEVLEHWRQRGSVAFVGDGLNDRLAMSRADLSIAVVRPEQSPPLGAMLRLPQAQLTRLPELLARLRFFGRLQTQLWVAALGYNIVMVLAASQGLLSPWLAIAIFATVSGLTLVLAHLRSGS